MTLTNRLTIFLVTTLLIVLSGFSLALYLLTQAQLYREFSARADACLGILTASVEIEPNGLEWDPKAEHLRQFSGEFLQWAAFDENILLGGSEHAKALPVLSGLTANLDPIDSQSWRVFSRVVSHPKQEDVVVSNVPGLVRYRQLNFIVALSISPLHQSLQALALRLTVITLATLLLVALFARWVCRKALLPLSNMTSSVRLIRAEDLSTQLPVPKAKDELHELGSAFNLLLTHVHEAFERQKHFTSQASHQLRTPLTAMLGQVELSLRRTRDSEEYKKTLHLVKDQAAKLNEMIEMLLFLARADSDARIPELEPVDLNKWLPVYMDQFWRYHPRYEDVQIQVMPGESIHVRIQCGLFEQAVGNLIDNAMKYSQAGTPISVLLSKQENQAILSLVDCGQGVDAGDIPQLFSPFFRSGAVRQRGIPGLGLGLAIAARIVKALGGRISFSNHTQGGTFAIMLPLC